VVAAIERRGIFPPGDEALLMGPDEAEVIARLTAWGEAQEQIRALLLTSS